MPLLSFTRVQSVKSLQMHLRRKFTMSYFCWRKATVLVLVALAFRSANGAVYYVATSAGNCSINATCNTLNYYAKSAALKLTDSVFYFMPGRHFLQQVWVIESASNLTLTSALPISERNEVVIYCSGISGLGVRVITSHDVRMKNIEIRNCSLLCTVEWSSVCFDSSSTVNISNLSVTSSQEVGLILTNSAELVVSHSLFANNSVGILVDNCTASCEVISTQLWTNNFGLQIFMYGNSNRTNATRIHLDSIDATNNRAVDIYIQICSAYISLTNSQSSAGFSVMQACYLGTFAETFVVEVQSSNFTNMYSGIIVQFVEAKVLRITISYCSVTNSSNNALYPGIVLYNYPCFDTCIKKELKQSSISISDITMKTLVAIDNTYRAIVLGGLENASITNITILHNQIGGLVMYNSVVEFGGVNTFHDNSGVYGGGIALYGSSYLVMKKDSVLNFTNNRAEKSGGAIYVSQDEAWILSNSTVLKEDCFIQLLDNLSTTIYFSGNKAKDSGSDLYGGNVDTCRQSTQLLQYLCLSTSATQCNPPNVSSDARNLAFCSDDNHNNATEAEETLSFLPGQGPITVKIAAHGQLQGLTQANIKLSYDSAVFDPDAKDNSEFINASCTSISVNIPVKRSDAQGNIKLTVSDDFIPENINLPIVLKVIIEPCPAGFNFSDTHICSCSKHIAEIAQCDIKHRSINRCRKSWIFPTNNLTLIYDRCPFDYCNNKTFSVDDPDGQCNYNRSGTLCGDCIQGYSLVLGSNDCANCTNQVWKLPIILLGSALAGIGLVTLLIVLNLTVSVGTINGLLFFVNVVKVFESTFYWIYVNKPVNKVLHLFLSWLNLDLGINTCFFDGMDACYKVGLQIAFPSYLLFLIVLIVAACRCGQWVGLRSIPWVVKISDKTSLLLGSKIVPVLATIILLSYTELVRIVTLIFQRANIEVLTYNANMSQSLSKWYVNGSLEYLAGCHTTLFLLGMGIVLPFISLFTAFLLLFPLMERYLPRFARWRSWHVRLKPWYDAYGGPYKDRYRFWTGLLVMVRCFLVLVVTIDSEQELAADFLVWVCLLFIPLVALLQIYKVALLNVLETIYFSALVLVVFMSDTEKSVQLYLVIVVLLSLVTAILLFHIGQQLRPTRLGVFLWQIPLHLKKNYRNHNQLVCTVSASEDNDRIIKCTPESAIKFANYSELREPLLDDAV